MGDAITATVFVFILAFIFLIGLYLTTKLQDTGNPTITTYVNYSHGAMAGMDSLAPFFIIAISSGLVFSALMINSHPIFFFAMMFVNVAFVVVSIGLSNAWTSSLTGSTLAATANSMTNFTAMFQYLPIIAMVISIIFAIALFVKGGNQ
jgi:hypothetical protein